MTTKLEDVLKGTVMAVVLSIWAISIYIILHFVIKFW
jgi:hypothetical protein